MYFPTVPDRFASPFGKRSLRDSNSRCGLHAYPAAMTNVFARNSTGTPAAAPGPRRTASARTTRVDPGSTTSRLTSVRVTRSTRFDARSALHVKSGEYFAPTGHTGLHVSLRQHTARPRYATEFFADG